MRQIRQNAANVPSAEPGHDDRRAEQRRARRSHLLDAAIAEIRVLGPGATMEQLAKAGGVTKPILYRHFGDREGLIMAIAERFSAELLMSVTTPLLETGNPRSLLDTTVGSYVAFLERDPYLYGFLIQQPNSRAEHRSPIGSLVDVIARQIAGVMREQMEEGGRDTDAALPWAYGIVGMVHQATDWWLHDRTMTREQFVHHLTDLLWDGLTGPITADGTSATGRSRIVS